MKKRILCLAAAIVILLNGCGKSSDQFLTYTDEEGGTACSAASQLMQADFFAKDLTVVTGKDNDGNDAELTAKASLFVNRTDNKVIYADNVFNNLYPASLTKLLTALVVLKYGELTDMVTVSYNASHITESGAKLCGFKEGDQISLEEMLNSMLVYSGNDAAVAIAEHVGGSVEDFVQMMNQEAKRIGAVHSNFVNPNGLHDDNQYTTAYDLYLIFNELLQYDTFRSIINQASYTANYKDKDGNDKEKTFGTTDLYLKGDKVLDSDLTVIGGKTGTTSKAGNCLILLSKDKSSKEYISVILKASGSEDLYTEMTHLLSLTEAK
jgi:D-alanyl-D-alanine carboxypeptidase